MLKQFQLNILLAIHKQFFIQKCFIALYILHISHSIYLWICILHKTYKFYDDSGFHESLLVHEDIHIQNKILLHIKGIWPYYSSHLFNKDKNKMDRFSIYYFNSILSFFLLLMDSHPLGDVTYPYILDKSFLSNLGKIVLMHT